MFCFLLIRTCSKQISTPVRVQGIENVKLIAVGAFHNLALSEHGEVWAWGNNEYGQLGTGDTQPHALPVPVKGLNDLIMVCTVAFLELLKEYYLLLLLFCQDSPWY